MPSPRACASRKKKYLCSPGGPNALYEKGKLVSFKRSNRGLDGVPQRFSKPKIRGLPKNHKRISRIYGGQTCHICLPSSPEQAPRTP